MDKKSQQNMFTSTYLSGLLILVFSISNVVGVIFQKGNENFYDNQYIETTNTQLTQECLEWHNYFRQLHGAQPLTYSHELEQIARYRAIELAKKDGTNFYHHDNMDVGENLAWNSQEPIDCRIPLQLWYDEWKTYNFRRPNINPRNGHFSQMVWKSSKRIGCGQAISKGSKGGTFTVCNYDPPGNWKGEELQNVSPPVSGVGVEWNPLGSNSYVELPPVAPTVNYSARKINKWLAKPSVAKNYYYQAPKKVSSWNINNNKKWNTYYNGFNKVNKSYRKSPLINYSYYG
ncbi:Golgi-associated plant pathogenesis-related protein 1-like [Dermatophagoides pteronyssinus]|uniref:Golgi-associated plant pathogenesis-related protein 1-like n=1 Tax=Dermatophagoides pteronyssinus TaxID=6956 RepID=UPI003F6667E8